MLIFDSRFESGNLRKAAKVNNIEYNLWLENDLNTRGHTQWFYFKVVYSSEKPAKIQFNILNLAKTYSLYKAGMKPVVFSLKKFQSRFPHLSNSAKPLQHRDGWQRACDNIKYVQNEIPRYNTDATKFAGNLNNDVFLQNNNGHGEGVDNYYTLSFDYKFDYLEDEVWFAHAVPYTYTDMQHRVKELTLMPDSAKIIRTEILANTLSGMPVPLLTITENVQSYMKLGKQMALQSDTQAALRKQFKQKYKKCRDFLRQTEESRGKVQKLLEQAFEEEMLSFADQHQKDLTQLSKSFVDFGTTTIQYMRDHAHKKAIVLTSRVHPGEPQASFMLEGSLKMLMSDTPLAKELRKHFVFKVVPMLNPDGVIHGNYRCSLLGCDLNRKWLTPNRFLHPTIYHTKQLIRYTNWERKVTLYCDMHGHSRKQNVFFFGCSYRNYEFDGRIKNAQLRILPLLCCHKNNSFSFAGSSFKMEKTKESTGRVVVFRDFNIMNSFTLECSFHGKQGSDGKITQMTLDDMRNVGSSLIQTLKSYLPSEQSNFNLISTKVLDIFYDEFIKFVPSYVLKREEEKQQDLKAALQHQLLDQSPSQAQLANQPQSHSLFRKKTTRKLMNKNQIVVGGPLPDPKQPQTSFQAQKKPQPRDQPSTTEQSDIENFSEIIAFNDRKDKQNLELNELELFINHQYKKGKETKEEEGGDGSSSDDDGAQQPTKQSRLPYVRSKKARSKPHVAVHAPGKSIPVTEKKTGNGEKLVSQPMMANNLQNPIILTSFQRQREKGAMQDSQQATQNSRQSLGQKSQSADDHLSEKSVEANDLRYAMVQEMSFLKGSPRRKGPDSDNYASGSDANDGGYLKEDYQHPLELRARPLTMLIETAHRQSNDARSQKIQDLRNVKSFSEYAEHQLHEGAAVILSQQSKSFQVKPGTSQSNFKPTSKQTMRTSNQPQLIEPSQSLIIPQRLVGQSLGHSEANLHNFHNSSDQRRGKPQNISDHMTNPSYLPMNPDQIRSRAHQLLDTKPQYHHQHVYVTQQHALQRKTNLDVIAMQIRTGGGTVIDERLIEAHRKFAQKDRQSIVGIGFQIKMRPAEKVYKPGQEEPRSHSIQPSTTIWSKQTNQVKKSAHKKRRNSKHMIIDSTAHPIATATQQSKLVSSRSQAAGTKMTQHYSNEQQPSVQDQQPQQQRIHPVLKASIQQEQQVTPLKSLQMPIKQVTKVQTSALRTHLKHKKNIQVPLPLHQQERLAAQEQNQFYPAVYTKGDPRSYTSSGTVVYTQPQPQALHSHQLQQQPGHHSIVAQTTTELHLSPDIKSTKKMLQMSDLKQQQPQQHIHTQLLQVKSAKGYTVTPVQPSSVTIAAEMLQHRQIPKKGHQSQTMI